MKLNDGLVPVLSDSPYIIKPGLPILPFKRVWLGLPPNAVPISVKVVYDEVERISLHEPLATGVAPCILDTGEPISVPKLEPTDPFPNELAKIEFYGFFRYYRVVSVAIFPLQYSPSRQELIVHRSMEIAVFCEQSSSISYTPLPFSQAPPDEFDFLAHLVLANYEQATEWRAKVERPTSRKPGFSLRTAYPTLSHADYVIICPNDTEIVRAMEDLAQTIEAREQFFHNTTFEAVVVTLEWINQSYIGRDLMEKVHNFLTDALNTWGIRYALLAFDADIYGNRVSYGSIEDLPVEGARYYRTYDFVSSILPRPPQEIPTDDYFAGLDHNWDLDNDYIFGEQAFDCDLGVEEIDYLYDIYVGRIPIISLNESLTDARKQAWNYANKVRLMYETMRAYNISFTRLWGGAILWTREETQFYTDNDGAWVVYHLSLLYKDLPYRYSSIKYHRLNETNTDVFLVEVALSQDPKLQYLGLTEENLTLEAFSTALEDYDIAVCTTVSHGSIGAVWRHGLPGEPEERRAFDTVSTAYGAQNSYLPVIFAMACLNGAFDALEVGTAGFAGVYEKESIFEAYARAPRGAIAYVANTREGLGLPFGNVNGTLLMGGGLLAGLSTGLCALFHKYRWRTGMSRVGAMLFGSKILYLWGGWGYSTFEIFTSDMWRTSWPNDYERRIVLELALAGDPAFEIWPPVDNHPPQIEILTSTENGVIYTSSDTIRVVARITDTDVVTREDGTQVPDTPFLVYALVDNEQIPIQYSEDLVYADVPVKRGKVRLVIAAFDRFLCGASVSVDIVRMFPVSEGSSLQFIDAYTPVFYDPCDQANGFWLSLGGWQITHDRAFMGQGCWFSGVSRSAEYLLISRPIDLPSDQPCVLSFYAAYALATSLTGYGDDMCYVEISDDGGETWVALDLFWGESMMWDQYVYDLSDYLGKTIQIRFRVIFGESPYARFGVYIDEIGIFPFRIRKTLFRDNAEGGVPFIVVTLEEFGLDPNACWFRVSDTYHSPYHSWWSGYQKGEDWPQLEEAGYYAMWAFGAFYLFNILPLEHAPGNRLALRLWHRYGFEHACDYAMIAIGIFDPEAWDVVDWVERIYSGFKMNWSGIWFPIPEEYCNRGYYALIQFYALFDSRVTADGWWIDDIELIEYSGGPPVLEPMYMWGEGGSPWGLESGLSGGLGALSIPSNSEVVFVANVSKYSEDQLFLHLFHQYYNLSSLEIYVSTDGSTWQRLFNQTGSHIGLTWNCVNLTDALLSAQAQSSKIWIKFVTSGAEGTALWRIYRLTFCSTNSPTSSYAELHLQSPRPVGYYGAYVPVTWLLNSSVAPLSDKVLIEVNGTVVARVPASQASTTIGPLDSGRYNIAVKVYDTQNSLVASSNVSILVDAEPPYVEVVEPANGSMVTSNPVTVIWEGEDPESGIFFFEYMEVNLLYATEGVWRYVALGRSLSAPMASGHHMIRVRAYDHAWNVYVSEPVYFDVDIIGPWVSVLSPEEGAMLGPAVTVNWTVKDYSGFTVFLQIDDGALIDVTDAIEIHQLKYGWEGSGTYTLHIEDSGAHSLTIVARDPHGFESRETVWFVVDATPPRIVITAPASGTSFVEGVDSSVRISWYLTENATVSLRIDGGDWIEVGNFSAYETCRYTISLQQLVENETGTAVGFHTVEIKAVDALGNEGYASTTFVVRELISYAPVDLTPIILATVGLAAAIVVAVWSALRFVVFRRELTG